jgi:hypothetical protein
VHNSVCAPDDRECLTGISQIGHLVTGRSFFATFKTWPGEVDRKYFVARIQQGLCRRSTNFAVGASDYYLHEISLSDLPPQRLVRVGS